MMKNIYLIMALMIGVLSILRVQGAQTPVKNPTNRQRRLDKYRLEIQKLSASRSKQSRSYLSTMIDSLKGSKAVTSRANSPLSGS